MNKWIIRVIALITGIACLLALALTVVQLVAFDRDRYEAAYDKNNQAQVIGISREELMSVTDRLLAYLQGTAPDLEIKATIQGQLQPVFGERELLHMKDVQGLFMKGFSLRRWAVVIAGCGIVFLLAAQKKRALYMLSWGYLAALAGFAVVAGLLAAAMSIDFYGSFTVFHQLLFTNDLWLLDPNTDVLIQMFPQDFFSDMAGAILAWMAAAVALPALPAGIYGIGRKIAQRRRTQ
jgi:integral membrane protein (TIGR01906 family)